MKTEMARQYLRNLNVDENLPKVELINKMIEQHLVNYSFNNIDLLLNEGQILSLEIDDLYQKTVERKRGGYCFEHNKLLFNMLGQLQFDVKACLARVTFNQDIEVPQSHRYTIVRIDGADYLADVGFGAYTPNRLIGFSGASYETSNGRTYRLKNLGDDIFALQIMRDGGFFTLYTCSTIACYEIDFDVANYYTNTHPDSNFTKSLSLAIGVDHKIIFVKQNILTVLDDDKRLETPILDAQQFGNIVEQYFKIQLSLNQAEKLFLSV